MFIMCAFVHLFVCVHAVAERRIHWLPRPVGGKCGCQGGFRQGRELLSDELASMIHNSVLCAKTKVFLKTALVLGAAKSAG